MPRTPVLLFCSCDEWLNYYWCQFIMFALLLFCFINYDGIVSNNPGKLHHIFLLKNIYQIILNHLSAAFNMDCYKPSLFLENQILSFSSISWCHDNSLFYWHSPYDHSVSIDTWFHIFYMIYFVPKLFILKFPFNYEQKMPLHIGEL